MDKYRRFIEAWFASRTVAEVCDKVGIDRRHASNMVSQLRRNGIELPHRAGGFRYEVVQDSIDYMELRQLVEMLWSEKDAARYRRGALA